MDLVGNLRYLAFNTNILMEKVKINSVNCKDIVIVLKKKKR